MELEPMLQLAEQLKALRDKKTELEASVKLINSEIEEVDFKLASMMAESETANFTHAGTMFSLTTKVRASAVTDHKDELFEALRREGYGDLVYETVNANSLSAFVKEQIAENEDVLPGWLDGLVSVFEKTSVGVRKSTRK